MVRKRSRKPSEPPDQGLYIFVRRGALRRFHRLKNDILDLRVEVTWDRRETERRHSSTHIPTEQRKDDRRKAPPFTWEAADFVVVDAPEDE